MQNIEINPNREYILCGDISASMQTADNKCGGLSRYKYMLEKFKLFIKTTEDFDEHGGCSVLLFGEHVKVFEHVKLEDIDDKLNNVDFEMFTNLHSVIDKAYEIHCEEKREQAAEKKFHPGSMVLVFTDGEPTNREAVKRSIVRIANEISREDEFQITLLTVGTRNNDLQRYLDNLHDGLENEIKTGYDIVHIEELEKTSFFAAISGAINHKE